MADSSVTSTAQSVMTLAVLNARKPKSTKSHQSGDIPRWKKLIFGSLLAPIKIVEGYYNLRKILFAPCECLNKHINFGLKICECPDRIKFPFN